MAEKTNRFEFLQKMGEYSAMREQQSFASEKFNSKVKIHQSSRSQLDTLQKPSHEQRLPHYHVPDSGRDQAIAAPTHDHVEGSPMDTETIDHTDRRPDSKAHASILDELDIKHDSGMPNASLKRSSDQLAVAPDEITKPTTKVMRHLPSESSFVLPKQEATTTIAAFCSPPKKNKKASARQSLPANLQHADDESEDADVDTSNLMDDSLNKLCADEKQEVEKLSSDFKAKYDQFERKSAEFLKRYHLQRIIAMHRQVYDSIRSMKADDAQNKAQQLDDLYARVVSLYEAETRDNCTAKKVHVEDVKREFVRMDCVGWRTTDMYSMLNDYF